MKLLKSMNATTLLQSVEHKKSSNRTWSKIIKWFRLFLFVHLICPLFCKIIIKKLQKNLLDAGINCGRIVLCPGSWTDSEIEYILKKLDNLGYANEYLRSYLSISISIWVKDEFFKNAKK